jgi:CxxC-x17-CxxC domain-containing protein
MYTDETLTCVDCNVTFAFTGGEQEFFAKKGLTNKPSRCPDCRTARKASRAGGEGSSLGRSRGPREMHSATCSRCGKEALVPFVPSGDKPVYCNDCFEPRRG